MAKSMEQRIKDGPLQPRWKAAQAKNKALDDRKFADLGKLLDSYDFAVGEYEDGAGDDDGAVDATFAKVNVAMTAFMNRNQELHKSLTALEAGFGKSLADLTSKRADRVNLYSILLAQLADKRRAVFADFVANDKATSDKVLDIVGDFAKNAQATAKLQNDVSVRCEKLSGQIRSTLQNYKRQVTDRSAGAAIDDLLKLL